MVVHPRLLQSLATFYPSRCTIQTAANINVKGDVIKAPWSDLAGHVSIPCRVAPATGRSREVRLADQVYAIASHTVALAGHYPDIRPSMRAVVDGRAYDIEAVEHDGQGATTWLQTRIVT